MEKRTILAIILSIMVLFAYQAMVVKKVPPPAQISMEAKRAIEPPAEREYSPAEDVAVEKNVYKEAPQVMISGKTLSLQLSANKGVMNEISLKNDMDFVLAEQEEASLAPFALWFGAGSGEDDKAFYKISSKENSALLTAGVDKDISVEKKVNFSDYNNGIELELNFKNDSTQSKNFEYVLVGASGIDISNPMDMRFAGVEAKVNGTIFWKNLKKGFLKGLTSKFRQNGQGAVWEEQKGLTEWVALRNTYYELVLKPRVPAAASMIRTLDGNVLACGVKVVSFAIPAKSTVSHQYLLYAGPSDYKYLSAHKLEETIFFGKLDFICKFLVKSLRAIYKGTRSYGLAIIILTLAMGLVLFPLTRKNFTSMRQMQLIQPHITKLKEIHKNDPHKMQREMMELYRKHKVNPLGGCLPMFLQMPLFISLYLTLIRSFDLKKASFLWIKDLSAPDAAFLLPMKLPFLGNQVNILPILMMGAMVAQQKISTYKRAKADPQTEQQQKMMLMMPLLFGIIFYNLPSGLVLYWLTNTLFMTAVHFYIAKTMPAVETVAG